jgi:hypothetical protein
LAQPDGGGGVSKRSASGGAQCRVECLGTAAGVGEAAALGGSRAGEVLDIPDDYEFMDPALVELIKTSVEPLLA